MQFYRLYWPRVLEDPATAPDGISCNIQEDLRTNLAVVAECEMLICGTGVCFSRPPAAAAGPSAYGAKGRKQAVRAGSKDCSDAKV